MRTEAEFYLDVSLPGAKAVTEGEEGDLLIEGYASDFGTDRQGEAFEPGAFSKAISKFLTGQRSLLYHHHNDQQLGEVLDLENRPDGLWMKALIPKPADSSPLLDVYNKVKRGMMKGLSVRGYFKRHMTPNGVRIHDMDMAEISVTPLPVNPRTLFAVAQKAFGDDDEREREAIVEYFANSLADLSERYDTLLEGKAATTFQSWDGSSGRFSDDQWRKSCVLDRGDSYDGKSRYALPVREPSGTLNCRAVAAAKSRLNQVKGASDEAKAAASRKLDTLSNVCERAHGS